MKAVWHTHRIRVHTIDMISADNLCVPFYRRCDATSHSVSQETGMALVRKNPMKLLQWVICVLLLHTLHFLQMSFRHIIRLIILCLSLAAVTHIKVWPWKRLRNAYLSLCPSEAFRFYIFMTGYVSDHVQILRTMKNISRVRRCIQKFPDWPPGARTANDTVLCH